MSGRQLTRDELEDRLDSLESAVEDLQARADAASRARDHLLDRVDDLEAENADLRGRVPDADIATDDDLQTLHTERAKLARRLCRVEEKLDVDDPIAAAENRDTPLHLLARVGPEAIETSPSETLRRAKTLLENKNRWGQTRTNAKHGQHRYLSSSDHDLKTRLEDARDEDLGWHQVYRAMRKLGQLGGTGVQFDESDSRGKMVVFRSGWDG